MMTEEVKIIKIFEPFILGFCRCGCSIEIDIFSPKSKGRRVGYLRKYLNSAHSLKGKNQSGENNPMWNGGQPRQDKDGYWLIHKHDHPQRNNENKVFLHRLLYEHYLSIILDEEVYLTREEQIHHINKDKEDNSLINLQYMPNIKEHKKEHRKDYEGIVCSICGSSETYKKPNGQYKWMGNEKDGWKCVSCEKKEYYL